jgi:CDGSH-type Zn-finger protein
MSTDNKASIKAAEDGPFVVKALQHCANKNGAIEVKEVMALCRCGASANKPYCDGTHSKIGFSSARLEGRTEDKRESYSGSKITIHDNRGVCAHAGICTDKLASVFRMKQEPWIDPDAASVDEIIAVIQDCPSGALSYSIENGSYPEGDGEASILIAENGPYVVTGSVELIDTNWGEGVSKNEYTLCRCGASKNKPFCDGSHWDINFTDDKN